MSRQNAKNQFFVSDLHGSIERYQKLFEAIRAECPCGVFLGGDLFPSALISRDGPEGGKKDFLNDIMADGFLALRRDLGEKFPRVFLILGNDDLRLEEAAVLDAAARGAWEYIHNRRTVFGNHNIYGYACVPPSPFRLKDWERYDVSRYVDPGCVSPEEGAHSIPVTPRELRYSTIQKDLEQLVAQDDLRRALMLFHSPPYQTKLDRAALDGKMIDYVPLDVHIGSIAIKRLIEARQPAITLHGHVHESARLTGEWKERIGATWCFSAAHDGPELSLIRFSIEHPEMATRTLI